jgi:Na+-transporting NADH:ubiquinone oxidoreductase subunit D
MSSSGHLNATAGVKAGNGKWKQTLSEGLHTANPITRQILGICSTLAVTNRLDKSLVMGAALIFVTGLSNLFLSLLRKLIPNRIRMIAEMAVVSTFVIVIDQFLRGFYWDISRQLGPYVALIITNCIVMGRAEAFALQNPPLLSLLDGAANAAGYAMMLAIVGVFRELLGSGSILGITLLSPSWYEKNLLLVLAPGAFFALGLLIWIFNVLNPLAPMETKK